MPIFPEMGQVAHPSLDADTALFYAHLSRKARTGERGIVGDGGKKRESGSRPFCDSDGFRACMSARETETSSACEAVAASAAIMATMGVPTSGEGVAAAALPQLERQSVSL